MEIVGIIIWSLVGIMGIFMMYLILFGAKAVVYVFDEHNGVYRKRGRVTGEKVSFKYNASTKGGVAIEGNKYKAGKKLVFLYRDVGGVCLPITDKKVNEKILSLDLSTSQEKLYETRALENVANKIDNTLWKQLQPIVVAGFILAIAMVVSIVMIQKAMDVTPVPEPQLLIWQDTNSAMRELVVTNQQMADSCSNQEAKIAKGEPPK